MWLPESPLLGSALEGEGAEFKSGCRESGGADGGSGGDEAVEGSGGGGGKVLAELATL